MGISERRKREREERRERIVEAAEKVFLAKGVDAATMEGVAREAELSKGALYLYFDSKDALYLAIATRALSDIRERVEQAALDTDCGFERLRAQLEAFSQYATQHPTRFQVSISWLSSSYIVKEQGEAFEQYRAVVGVLFMMAVSSIAQGQSDGSVRDDVEPGKLAIQLWGAVMGTCLVRSKSHEMARRLPEPVPLDGMVESFVALVLDGIRRPRGDPLQSTIEERSA